MVAPCHPNAGLLLLTSTFFAVYLPPTDAISLSLNAGNRSKRRGRPLEFPPCEPERRAQTARVLQDLYFEHWADRVSAPFNHIREGAYLTVIEYRAVPLFRNFVAHMRNVSRQDKTHLTLVNVALDAGGAKTCLQIREQMRFEDGLSIYCVDITGWLPSELFTQGVQAGPGTCIYNLIIWSKPGVLLTAAGASQHPVLLIDTDVMLYHDLLPEGQKILKRRAAAVLVTGHELAGRRNPNTGTVLCSKVSADFLQQWVERNYEFVNSQFGDQGAFQDLIKDDAMWNQMGIFSPDEVGQCGRRGRLATHYNCLGGRKGVVMRNRGDWNASADSRNLARERLSGAESAKRAEEWQDFDEADSTIEVLREAGEWWVDAV